MSLWTLQYYDSSNALQEVSFSQLAALEGGRVVSDAWQARFQSHKASSVTLNLPGVPPHIAPAIPFESRVTIWSGRTSGDGGYSGGTKQFQGLRTDRKGTADPHKSASSYQFDDEWYFLDHCPYQQLWLRVTDTSGDTSIVPFSNVVLYQPNPGETYSPAAVNGVITTGQQIVDILNWAILMGANLQVGQIDPALYQAWYPVQNIKCGDALRHCLRLHPDCFTEIDYTTTPPTFNVRQRSNLSAVTLPYAYTDSSGRRHTATEIQPRPELQPRRVALFYRVIENNYLLGTPVDIYPSSNLSVLGPVFTGQSVGGSSAPYTVGGTPVVGTAMLNINTATTATIPVGAPGGLRALDFSIDLQGPKLAITKASITTTPFDPTNLNWWRNKVPSLRQLSQGGAIPNDGDAGALQLLSVTINGGGAHDITVQQDGTGTALSLGTYAFELLPQSAPMAWMTASTGGSLQVAEATVTAHFSYTRHKTLGSGSIPVKQPNDHVHHVRVKLCNSASLTAQFSQYITTGEATPPNLAQNVYNSLSTLQYSFSHTLVEKPFNGWLKPGQHAINLAGGATAWTTMSATVQQTDYKMHLDAGGNTFDNFTVKCGPVEHLEPGQLIQLFNVFANRDLNKIDTNERLSGLPSPGNTLIAANDTAQENSIPSEADEAMQIFSAPDTLDGTRTIAVSIDPANSAPSIRQLSTTDGSTLVAAGVMAEFTGTGAPGTATLA